MSKMEQDQRVLNLRMRTISNIGGADVRRKTRVQQINPKLFLFVW